MAPFSLRTKMVVCGVGNPTAITPGKTIRTGTNIHSAAAISGDLRADSTSFAAMAVCSSLKSVHHIPPPSTSPTPSPSPTAPIPVECAPAFAPPLHSCKKPAGTALFNPFHPPILFRPSATNGSNPATTTQNCRTWLYMAAPSPPSRTYASTSNAGKAIARMRTPRSGRCHRFET